MLEKTPNEETWVEARRDLGGRRGDLLHARGFDTASAESASGYRRGDAGGGDLQVWKDVDSRVWKYADPDAWI